MQAQTSRKFGTDLLNLSQDGKTTSDDRKKMLSEWKKEKSKSKQAVHTPALKKKSQDENKSATENKPTPKSTPLSQDKVHSNVANNTITPKRKLDAGSSKDQKNVKKIKESKPQTISPVPTITPPATSPQSQTNARSASSSPSLNETKTQLDNLFDELNKTLESATKTHTPATIQIAEEQEVDEELDLRRKLRESESYINALRKLLVKTMHDKEKLEYELEKKQARIEMLESHVTELSLLYEIARTTSDQPPTEETPTDVEGLLSKYLPGSREEELLRLRKETRDAKEEIHALRFSNEVLIQKIGDTRGKYLSMLQDAYKEKRIVQEEAKADSEAWNELMNTTVKQLEEKMKTGVAESIQKVKTIEKELVAQKAINQQLLHQLEELKSQN